MKTRHGLHGLTLIVLAAIALLPFCSAPAARAQNVVITLTNASGGITTISGPADMVQQLVIPPAVQGQLPAFNPNGQSFTNVSIKVESG